MPLLAMQALEKQVSGPMYHTPSNSSQHMEVVEVRMQDTFICQTCYRKYLCLQYLYMYDVHAPSRHNVCTPNLSWRCVHCSAMGRCPTKVPRSADLLLRCSRI